MIRRCLSVGITLAMVHGSSARAWAEAAVSDSSSADSTLHGWRAPALWHPTRADTLMFQSVSRRVKPDATARVFSRYGTVEVPGRAMSLEGVHRFGRAESTFLWADVTNVQVRKSSSGQGALVGGIVFGAAGLIGMASMTHDCGTFEITCGASSGDVVAGTIGAFAIGTLLGALVTAPFHHWADVPIDKDVTAPSRSTFDDSRRGFTIELSAGPGWASTSIPFSTTTNTEVTAFTRFRLGHGFSERWAAAYVNDVAWKDGLSGITGVGVTRFTSSKTPSLALELVGGVATRQGADQSLWSPGVQAGLGVEFSRHWLLRASILHTTFDSVDYNAVGTSIGRLWY